MPTRRRFLTAVGLGGFAISAAPGVAAAQGAARVSSSHVKPFPKDVFIDHGLNQETRPETLRGYLTPASHFFVRSHSNTPTVDLRTWRLSVDGNAVERPVQLSFDDLLRLPSRSVISYVECAGNGRAFFKEAMGKVASGTQWKLGAILARATDEQGHGQPASIPWNAQGYGYNVPVPHPVKVS